VNRLPDGERRAERQAGEAALAERIREPSPRTIVIVMSAIQENVRLALQAADLATLPVEVLPFPARPEHERRYISELAEIVRLLRTQRVFSEPPGEIDDRDG
jgi:hypothetical protein